MQVPGVIENRFNGTFNHKIRELSWEKLENGGSSYLISWSIYCRTEIQVGTNRCDNDNHELHDLDSSWILTLWKVIREWSADCRLLIHTIKFCLFTFQTSRKTRNFSPRNDATTYHDEALIYYSYNRTWISFMFQNFIMSLHFQLLWPSITTVFRSKPKLEVLLGKLRPYTFGLIVAGPKPR